jgi:DNA topoisomerase-1
VRLLSEADASTLVDTLGRNLPWSVTSVEAKPGVERPAPPFTTSTLTQEASRKLGFSTQRTMQAAQRLFQDGHISVPPHRLDDAERRRRWRTRRAPSARCSATTTTRRRAAIRRRSRTRRKRTKPSGRRISAARAALDGVLERRRSAPLRTHLEAHDGVADGGRARAAHIGRDHGATADGEPAVFTASGKAIEFAGFRRAYVEGSDDPSAELEEQETVLPALTVGERIARDETRVRLASLEPKGHETSPPARYTEASLIKELERIGVGRPSTFAATIGTIERRGYVFRQGKALVPSFTAFAVTRLLREHFGDLVDVEFTAEMEEDLDQISTRRARMARLHQAVLPRRCKHHRGLEEAVKQAQERADYPLISVGVDPDSGEQIRVRIGRYGPFLQLGEGGPGKTAGLPPTLPPADLTVEKAMALIRAKAEGPRLLGVDPKTGMNVYAINGRFGAYVQLGEMPEKGARRSRSARR